MRAAAIAEALVQALPAMLELLANHPRPFVAKVSRTGIVSLLN